MKQNLKIFTLFITTLLLRSVVIAQIPVEVFVGHKKVTVDIMFFKYLKNKEAQNSDWLFFNRNRASIDYAMTSSTNLPQFGFTEAISYNNKKWKGFAPVAVVQILNKSVYPKVGIQFAKIHKDYTIFTWVVCETLENPNVDFFFLGRYTPKLTNKLNLFTQLELVNALPTLETNNFNFIQRLRLGLKVKEYQFGFGSDFSTLGKNNFTTTQNIGVFLRYEF